MIIDDDLLKQWEPKIQKMCSNLWIPGYDRDDLAQELRIAVIKSAKAYEENRGASFHTYLHSAMVNTIRTLLSKSNKQVSIISLSEIIPSALIKINKGIGFLQLGIETTICLLVNLDVSSVILIEKVLCGFDVSSETDLISAACVYLLPGLFFTIYKTLFAMFS